MVLCPLMNIKTSILKNDRDFRVWFCQHRTPRNRGPGVGFPKGALGFMGMASHTDERLRNPKERKIHFKDLNST